MKGLEKMIYCLGVLILIITQLPIGVGVGYYLQGNHNHLTAVFCYIFLDIVVFISLLKVWQHKETP